MKLWGFLTTLILSIIISGCAKNYKPVPDSIDPYLFDLINDAPGTVGIAFVSDKDTILVNNGVRYPMMSVFKLHQGLAVCNALEKQGTSLDTLIQIKQTELDHETWSPMLKIYSEKEFEIPVKELLHLSITSSDNNASNLLFDRIISPSETEKYIKSIASDTTFSILYSEAEMKKDNELSYCNYTTPLSAALLIRKVFTDSISSPEYQEVIKRSLSNTETGNDRLRKPLVSDSIFFAHKTGSGYRKSNGELVAFNDVAYIRFPDGRDYALAVLMRDFYGSESEAASLMAHISEVLYNYFTTIK